MVPIRSLLALLLVSACAGSKGDTGCPEVYPDADRDGHVADGALDGCDELSDAEKAAADDCDDVDASVYPGAEEVAGDEVDQDCDGLDDPVVGGDDTGATTAEDSDHDGTPDAEDCDPYDDDAFPGAVETCDGTDNDCNGEIDDEAGDASTWYADADGDGYGDPAVTTTACDAPEGYVGNALDCDDTDAETHPYADELDDGLDNDCDGTIDEGTDATDDDADGYSEDGGDCDDGSSAIYPGATEIRYDRIDQDCSGADLTDVDGDGYDAIDAGGDDPDDTDASIYPGWDTDADGDDYTVADGDCDDTDEDVHPGARERCNGIDDDCDGEIDEDVSWLATYPDDDGDGYGDTSGAIVVCDDVAGYSEDSSDCDDADVAVHPGADEICDDVDNDCDGLTDEMDPGDPAASLWYYPDMDGDGSATSDSPDFTWEWACEAPGSHYAASTGDCDDTYGLTYPGATEVCDGERNDCDESSTWWAAHAQEQEAGIVSFIADDGDVLTDWSAEAASGSDGAPTSIALTEDGALNFCADDSGTTWFVAISADDVSVSVDGLYGSDATILSGGGAAVPIDISDATADVSGLTLRDGYSESGGGLHASLSTLDLSDAVLDGNDAYHSTYYNDSALSLNLSTARLSSVTVTGSNASYAIGAYVSDVAASDVDIEDNAHSGVYLYDSVASFEDSQVIDNAENGFMIYFGDQTSLDGTVVQGNQRGIYALQAGVLTINDSTFLDNGYALAGGGAIYVYYSGSVVAMDTTFDSNHSNCGGAIYLNYAATLALSGTGSCEMARNVDYDANAVCLGTAWSGTLSSAGCTWEEGQDIYFVNTGSTASTASLSSSFSCTTSGCY